MFDRIKNTLRKIPKSLVQSNITAAIVAAASVPFYIAASQKMFWTKRVSSASANGTIGWFTANEAVSDFIATAQGTNELDLEQVTESSALVSASNDSNTVVPQWKRNAKVAGYIVSSSVLSTPFVLGTYILTEGGMTLKLTFAAMQLLGTSSLNAYSISNFFNKRVPAISEACKNFKNNDEQLLPIERLHRLFLAKLDEKISQLNYIPKGNINEVNVNADLRSANDILASAATLTSGMPAVQTHSKSFFAKAGNALSTLVASAAGVCLAYGVLPLACSTEYMMEEDLSLREKIGNPATSGFTLLVTLPLFYLAFQAGYDTLKNFFNALVDGKRFNKAVPTSWLLGNAISKCYSFLALPMAYLISAQSGSPSAMLYEKYCFEPHVEFGMLRTTTSGEPINIINVIFNTIYVWMALLALRLGLTKIFGEEHQAFALKVKEALVILRGTVAKMSMEDFETYWEKMPEGLKHDFDLDVNAPLNAAGHKV